MDLPWAFTYELEEAKVEEANHKLLNCAILKATCKDGNPLVVLSS